MKKYISLLGLFFGFGILMGSQSLEKKKVGFSDNLVVCVYNENMPITRDVVVPRAVSQKFVLFHSVSSTKEELLQDAPWYKKALSFMGCTPHLRSPYSEKK